MKKTLTKIFYIIISTLLMLLSFSGCFLEGGLAGDNANHYEKVEKEGYTYYYNQKEDYYFLAGDKKEDNPACWIIEPYLNNKEVIYFGMFYGEGWTTAGVRVPSLINVEELYLPYNMVVPRALAGRSSLTYLMPTVPQKVFLVNNIEDDSVIDEVYQGTSGYSLFAYTYIQKEPLREIYFTPIGYTYRVEKLLENSVPWTEGTQEYANGEYHFYRESDVYNDLYVKICKANTSYMFNYENSPNDDYFFIRDYEYGEKIETVPYEPIREGYTFAGWYKEPKCINVWNFEQDTLPETLYNENNEEVYQEIKLYAKWIKQ